MTAPNPIISKKAFRYVFHHGNTEATSTLKLNEGSVVFYIVGCKGNIGVGLGVKPLDHHFRLIVTLDTLELKHGNIRSGIYIQKSANTRHQ